MIGILMFLVEAMSPEKKVKSKRRGFRRLLQKSINISVVVAYLCQEKKVKVVEFSIFFYYKC